MLPILITLGEPAGIGPDCVLLAHQSKPEKFSHTIIIAPIAWLEQRAKMLNINTRIIALHGLNDFPEVQQPQCLYCWNPVKETPPTPIIAGQPSPQTAKAVIACIEAAAQACIEQRAAALVTAPIEKAVLRDAGFDFPGHTEFLAHLGNDSDIVMMLASSALRVALLTTHMPLQDVPNSLSIEKTLRCIEITHHDLQQRFGIEQPRLGLCGLNPHAGEQGHFGHEEIDILQPAAQLAQQAGIQITSPLPADTLFSAQMRPKFDAIVCCYHDQALIPIKALSFGDAVNVTLGLPFIRTSVDHGTALDRAGSGKISYSSLIEAIALAQNMRQNEISLKEASVCC